MDMDLGEAEGACHCGGVRFRAVLVNGLHTARRCDCSFCRMRGSVAVSARALTVLSGAEHLSEYQFNTRLARHHFCSICGIYTHHRRRSDPTTIGVNVACLDGISPFDFVDVPVTDGVHHPSDGFEPRLAGRLVFVPNET